MTHFIEVLKALTPLTWPLLLAVVLWKLFPLLRSVIESRSFSVKVAGMEVTVQAATDQIRTQIEDLQNQVLDLRRLTGSADGASSPPSVANSSAAQEKALLWVDDRPSRSAIEIARLDGLGIRVVQALSTNDAMEILAREPSISAIVSDMGRREEGEYRGKAGLIFLRALRRAGYNLPFIVYSAAKYVSANDAMVKAEGGDGATASSVELFEWIDRNIKLN